MGAFAQHDTCAVLAPVAGDHLRARLAARMDRNHHHLRAYLPADVEALQHRPDPVGYTRVRELAGGVPVAAGRDVGVLSQGRLTEACHAQPDLRRHDALHADRYLVHGDHVSLAGDDAVAAELPLRRLRRYDRGQRYVISDLAGRHSEARDPTSGLPEFGNIIVQVGDSRLGWRTRNDDCKSY